MERKTTDNKEDMETDFLLRSILDSDDSMSDCKSDYKTVIKASTATKKPISSTPLPGPSFKAMISSQRGKKAGGQKIANPDTLTMICEAIDAIDNKNGVSVQAIKKWIFQKYLGIDQTRFKYLLRLSLLKGISKGILIRPKTSSQLTGAVGRFRISKQGSAVDKSAKSKQPLKENKPEADKQTKKKVTKTSVNEKKSKKTGKKKEGKENSTKAKTKKPPKENSTKAKTKKPPKEKVQRQKVSNKKSVTSAKAKKVKSPDVPNIEEKEKAKPKENVKKTARNIKKKSVIPKSPLPLKNLKMKNKNAPPGKKAQAKKSKTQK